MSQAVQIKVLDRTYGKGRGWVVTPKRFLDLGSRDAVEQIGNMIVHQAGAHIQNRNRNERSILSLAVRRKGIARFRCALP